MLSTPLDLPLSPSNEALVRRAEGQRGFRFVTEILAELELLRRLDDPEAAPSDPRLMAARILDPDQRERRAYERLLETLGAGSGRTRDTVLPLPLRPSR